MKPLLLLAIEYYWRVVPSRLRRKCLFREPCSIYVYRSTCESGLVGGLRAFVERIRRCRGFRVESSEFGVVLVLADGSVLRDSEASEALGPFYCRGLSDHGLGAS